MPARNRFRDVARRAREKTNARLSEELLRITPLTESQLNRLLPTKADRVRLARLLAIVHSSTRENTKVARLRDELDELGGVAVRLLRELL